MSTRMTCPHCATRYRTKGTAPDDHEVACPKCGKTFTVGEAKAVTASTPAANRSGMKGRTVAGCRIEEKIGQGGMGAVYKAHHINLDIPVAIKFLPPQFEQANPKLHQRFLREARAAAKLHHKHVVGVMSVGKDKGVHYIVMEYVDGENLEHRIARDGSVTPAESLKIMLMLCEALKAAHQDNIVHRDIKPGNVMIAKDGTVKLADLGLAKDLEDDPGVTDTGMGIGTPHYIAPEQAADAAKADHRSDIYALGCTWFHAVTGRLPYPKGTSYATVLAHANDPVPDAHDVNAFVPRDVADLIKKMMAKKPDDRYQTPTELEKAVRTVARHYHAAIPVPVPADEVAQKPTAGNLVILVDDDELDGVAEGDLEVAAILEDTSRPAVTFVDPESARMDSTPTPPAELAPPPTELLTYRPEPLPTQPETEPVVNIPSEAPETRHRFELSHVALVLVIGAVLMVGIYLGAKIALAIPPRLREGQAPTPADAYIAQEEPHSAAKPQPKPEAAPSKNPPPATKATEATAPSSPKREEPVALLSRDTATVTAPPAQTPVRAAISLPRIPKPDAPGDDPERPRGRQLTRTDFLKCQARTYPLGMTDWYDYIIPAEWAFQLGDPQKDPRFVDLKPEDYSLDDRGRFVVQAPKGEERVALVNKSARLDTDFTFQISLVDTPRFGIIYLDAPAQSQLVKVPPAPEGVKKRLYKGCFNLSIGGWWKDVRLSASGRGVSIGLALDKTSGGRPWIEFPKDGTLRINSCRFKRFRADRRAKDYLNDPPRKYARHWYPSATYLIAAEWTFCKGDPTEGLELLDFSASGFTSDESIQIRVPAGQGRYGMIHKGALLDDDFEAEIAAERISHVGIIDPEHPERSVIFEIGPPDPLTEKRKEPNSPYPHKRTGWANVKLKRELARLTLTVDYNSTVTRLHDGERAKGYLYIGIPEDGSLDIRTVMVRRE